MGIFYKCRFFFVVWPFPAMPADFFTSLKPEFFWKFLMGEGFQKTASLRFYFGLSLLLAIIFCVLHLIAGFHCQGNSEWMAHITKIVPVFPFLPGLFTCAQKIPTYTWIRYTWFLRPNASSAPFWSSQYSLKEFSHFRKSIKTFIYVYLCNFSASAVFHFHTDRELKYHMRVTCYKTKAFEFTDLLKNTFI